VGFFIKFMPMNLFMIPLMTGLLGWLITWLFVKLIFWPNHAGIKKLLGQLDISLIINKENSKQQFEAILPTIDQQLNDFFTHKLGAKLPMVSMFIGDKTIEQLKEVFVEELREIFPYLIQHLAAKTKNDFSENLSTKWRPLLESSLLKATRIYRIIAFSIGIVWGILILILTHHV